MTGTTLKVGSTLTTPTGSTPGIKLTANASSPASQSAFGSYDYLNSPIWVTNWSGVSTCFGDKVQAINGNGVGVGFDGRAGRTSPGGMFWPTDRTTGSVGTQGVRLFSGSGAPSVDGAAVGDLWIRTDTPTTANQRVYRCTAGGSPGTWAAVK